MPVPIMMKLECSMTPTLSFPPPPAEYPLLGRLACEGQNTPIRPKSVVCTGLPYCLPLNAPPPPLLPTLNPLLPGDKVC